MGPVPEAGPRIAWRRRLYGFVIAVAGAPLLTALLLPAGSTLGLDTVLLLFVLVSVAASAVGGVLPAVVASLLGFGVANFFFATPYGTFLVANEAEALNLVVFLAVSVLVGIVTEMSAQVRGRAERSRLEADWLAELGSHEFGSESVERALAEARQVFGMNAASLTENGRTLVASGAAADGDILVAAPAGEGRQLVLSGPERVGQDRALLGSVAVTVGRLWRSRHMAEQARRAEELARIDELRASLLAAVGHDLRNPLAAISAAASTLRQTDLELSVENQTELLETIVSHVARLDSIIGNLLDMSRLQAGVLSVTMRPTAVLEALPSVVSWGSLRVELDIPEDLPLVAADAGLLERVIANLVDNAVRHQPPGRPVMVRGRTLGSHVLIEIVDTGPGVDPAHSEEIFAPFQHFDDRTTTGIGLGLAIARGFTEAMGGTVSPSDTPGGGLTMTVSLEVADGPAADR